MVLSILKIQNKEQPVADTPSPKEVEPNSMNVFEALTTEPFTTISNNEMTKILEMTEIERVTRIPLGEAMFMEISDENSCSWNLCTTFVKAALTGLSLHYEAICWAYTMAIRKLTK